MYRSIFYLNKKIRKFNTFRKYNKYFILTTNYANNIIIKKFAYINPNKVNYVCRYRKNNNWHLNQNNCELDNIVIFILLFIYLMLILICIYVYVYMHYYIFVELFNI